MSNLVPVFSQLLDELEAKQAACGIILAACKNLSNERLEAIKRSFDQDAPDVTAHYAYDQEKMLLGVLLERRKLGDTHFHALRIKAYLLANQLLSGGMLVAGFSGGSRAAVRGFMEMLRHSKELKGFGEIHIYDSATNGGGEDPASILLVNPDPTVNEFLTIYLQRKGYQVIVANDGLEGMQRFEESMPDLVITDLNLPVLNGYQLMERIRHSEKAAPSKIVVLTDKRLEEDMRKSFALGAADYITKPFSPAELEARVKRLIS